jgi:hypothetical protein
MRKDIKDYRNHVEPAIIDGLISDLVFLSLPKSAASVVSRACDQLEKYKELLEAMYLDSLSTTPSHKEDDES